MYRISIFTLLSMLITGTTVASIHEIHTISQVYNYLPQDQLFTVICDIDNTILEPTTWYGSDQWLEHAYVEEKSYGYSDRQAFDRVLQEYIRFYREEMVPKAVESEVIELIRYVHTLGCPIYAITSRSVDLEEVTHDHLAHVGVQMTETESGTLIHDMLPLYISSGVVFSAGFCKGHALRKLCDHVLSELPTHIVYIDDKRSHVEDIVAVCHDRGIPVTGLRYGYCDAYYG